MAIVTYTFNYASRLHLIYLAYLIDKLKIEFGDRFDRTKLGERWGDPSAWSIGPFPKSTEYLSFSVGAIIYFTISIRSKNTSMYELILFLIKLHSPIILQKTVFLNIEKICNKCHGNFIYT